MALRAGEKFETWAQVPEPSRPTTRDFDINEVPDGQGEHYQPRYGGDGTHWCLACLTTLPPDSNDAFCTACKKARKNAAEARRRARLRRERANEGPETVTLNKADLNQLSEHAKALEHAVSVILAAKHAKRTVTLGHVMDLAGASKDLTALVESQFRPYLADPGRPKRRQF